MILSHDFAARWHEFSARTAAERRRYVVEELRRLDTSGAPIVTALLQSPYSAAALMGLEILRTGQSPDGERVFSTVPRHQLRLREGAAPPDRDPQGRPLSAEQRGKVLVAKVGNIGAVPSMVAEADASVGKANSALARRQREMAGRDLYLTVEVTREPRDYTLDQAVKVLRQWGHGVQLQQAQAIVEEVPQQRPAQGRSKAA